MVYVAHLLEKGDRNTYARRMRVEIKLQIDDETLSTFEQEIKEDQQEIEEPDFFLSHHKSGAGKHLFVVILPIIHHPSFTFL